MVALDSCPKHNMVSYLEKTEQNAQFHKIVDFLTRSLIYYSLIVSPTISTFLIEQFWNTATSKTVNNVSYIKSKVAGKAVSISEASIRRDLLFNDVDGIGCLTNSEIYANLQLMGVFTNMAKQGLHFSGHVTPLFPNMLTQAVVDEGEGSEQPTKPQPTPSPTQPSTGDQHPVIESSSRHDTTQVPRVNLEGTSGSQGDQVQIPNDSLSLGSYTSDRAKGGLNLDELFVLCTNLSNRVLVLETFKDAQAAEILTLKTKIKKLEKKCKPSISHHKAWLKSVSRLSMKKKLTHDIDYMETEEVVNEGRQSKETEELNMTHDTEVLEKRGSNKEPVNDAGNTGISTVVPEVSTVNISTANSPEVSTTTPMTPPTTISVFEDEDIFLTDALVMLSDKRKLKGVAIKEVEKSDRPARSVLTLKPLPIIDPKYKGKCVLEDPDPAKKMTKSDFDVAQVARDEEVARQVKVEWQAKVERERQREEEASMDYIANLYDEVQVRIDADHELAVRWTHDEQEKYTVDERAKLLAEFFEIRKKQLTEERAAAIRNKPPTRTQLRSLMMTYLKHTGRFKHSQLNKKTFEEIQALYIKEQERAADFVPIGSEEDERQIQKMNKKVASVHEEKVLKEYDSTKINKKDAGESSEKGKDTSKMRKEGPRMKRISKKKKTDSDLEEEEHLKTFLKIVPDKEELKIMKHGEKGIYYKIFRSDGSSRWIKTFFEMVKRFDRLDLVELYNMVMQRFETTTLEGVDLVLWGDLRIMFDANAENELWQNQERWNLKKRKYPLTKETLKRMMSLKLIAECASESAYNLLRFIQKHIDESGSHDGISTASTSVSTGSIVSTVSMPWIYLGQFWHTLKEDGSKYRLRFMIDRKELTLTVDDFITIFHLPQFTDNKDMTFLSLAPKFQRCIFFKIPDDKYHNLDDDEMVKIIFNSGKHKDGVGMKIPSLMITDEMKLTENYRMYAAVFGVDVPTTQSQPIESTQGMHKTTSTPRTPNPNVATGESNAPQKQTVIRLKDDQQELLHQHQFQLLMRLMT
ncbi:hypothetical protein Tco_0588467 [Tanacetum coccineum]